jgi:aryl-alcohol dehydrogenase-like predicted oxidoreductase
VRLSAWMSRIRDGIFLASKTGDRTASGAYESTRRSLDRLPIDHLDLIQLHAVGDLEDLGRATGPGGGLKGALRAKNEVVKAIGIPVTA